MVIFLFAGQFLFAGESVYHFLPDMKHVGQIALELGLNTMTSSTAQWGDDSTPDYFEISINPSLGIGYDFNAEHGIYFQIPYYYASHGYNTSPVTNYQAVAVTVAYEFEKAVKDIHFSINPHVTIPVFSWNEPPRESYYLLDTKSFVPGIRLGITGGKEEIFFWNARINYDSGFSKDNSWSPGTIQIGGDIVIPFFISGNITRSGLNRKSEVNFKTEFVFSFGITQNVFLSSYQDSVIKPSIPGSTVIRLEEIFLRENYYFIVKGELAIYPVKPLFSAGLIFGYKFSTRSSQIR
jgi:hypothetical protein